MRIAREAESAPAQPASQQRHSSRGYHHQGNNLLPIHDRSIISNPRRAMENFSWPAPVKKRWLPPEFDAIFDVSTPLPLAYCRPMAESGEATLALAVEKTCWMC